MGAQKGLKGLGLMVSVMGLLAMSAFKEIQTVKAIPKNDPVKQKKKEFQHIETGFTVFPPSWQEVGQGILERNMRKVVSTNKKEDPHTYVTTSKGVYASAGRSFQKILSFPQTNFEINDVCISKADPSGIYWATDQGLYFSKEGRSSIDKIFSHSHPGTRACQSVYQDTNKLYVGTGNGLFVRDQDKRVWRKVNEDFNDTPVYGIDSDDEYIYLYNPNAVFRINKKEKVCESIYQAGNGNLSSYGLSMDSRSLPRQIFHMSVMDGRSLLIAASKGIFFSSDHGAHWEPFRSPFHQYPSINDIICLKTSHGIDDASKSSGKGDGQVPFCPGGLLVATKRGAFLLTRDRKISLYKGLATNVINDLAMNRTGGILAATERGLFYLPVKETLPRFTGVNNAGQDDGGTSRPGNHPVGLDNGFSNHQGESSVDPNQLEALFAHEPSITQVQRWAIEYAEVSNRKIQQWRKQARQRAWLPRLSMGLDGAKDKTVSDCVYGSYSSGGQSYIGPDDKTFYDKFGWDVSLTWDLADLIYTSEQTSIDSRSKLMVELREDILDQVTRLYFERRRLQMEYVLTEAPSYVERMEKELRIQELTSLIDGMTGGRFFPASPKAMPCMRVNGVNQRGQENDR
jgi:hypothetical protein